MTGERLNRAVVWLLTIGLAYGAVQQGGFYPVQFQTVVIMVLLAGALATIALRTKPSRWVALVLAALLGLVTWGMVAAASHDVARKALPIAVICLMLASAVYATTAITSSARRLFAHTLMAVGLIVAATSWWGVANHHYPWALPSQTLWRGASTLTYANAAAALLFPCMVLAAVLYLQSRNRMHFVVLYALAVGWTATLSRAAVTSLVIALVIYLVRVRDRRVVLRLWPLLPATAVAFLALLPSLPEHGAAHPGVAVAGVLAGLAMLIAGTRIRPLICLFALTAVSAVALGVVVSNDEARTAFDRINSTRVGVQSHDRVDLTKVTWEQFRSHPLLGVGPQQIDFVYVNHAGESVRARYTHNEYLQLAAEIGAPALLFLTVLLVGLASGLRQRTLEHVGGLIVLVSFAVHSALDFLWHIPEVTLLAIVVVCVLAGGMHRRTTEADL
jgi:hypothetical protein